MKTRVLGLLLYGLALLHSAVRVFRRARTRFGRVPGTFMANDRHYLCWFHNNMVYIIGDIYAGFPQIRVFSEFLQILQCHCLYDKDGEYVDSHRFTLVSVARDWLLDKAIFTILDDVPLDAESKEIVRKLYQTFVINVGRLDNEC